MNRFPPFAVGLAFVLACSGPAPSAREADVVVRLPDGDCRAGQSCTLDFGDVEVNAGRVRALDILNLGGTDAVITHVGLTGNPVFRLNVDNPGPLPAGGSLPFAISVTPNVPYTLEAVLHVLSSDGADYIQVNLRVKGTLLDLGFSPDCDFGDVAVGTTSTPCTFTLTNSGEADVQVDGIGVDMESTVFRVNTVVPLPFIIPPGGSFSLALVAVPVAVGPVTGSLSVARGGNIVSGAAHLRVNGI